MRYIAYEPKDIHRTTKKARKNNPFLLTLERSDSKQKSVSILCLSFCTQPRCYRVDISNRLWCNTVGERDAA